ncbi:MAG: c-type cytochrome biogenesis protein CcsB [Zetaproteobacteria bacterium]|nr:MAG: c-type cytochrome biogenesis protein CcsB [Zetaproteobacteria bacterium]
MTLTQPSLIIYRGKVAVLRCWAYLGLIGGMAALALFGGGYREDAFLFQALGWSGAAWGGAGLLAGIGTGALLARGGDAAAGICWERKLVPWLDGALLMILLMGLWSLLEPPAGEISYEDQSNLVSGRIIMAMNVLFLFAAVCYIAQLFAPTSFIGRMGSFAAWCAVYAGGSALLLRWYESYQLLGGDIGHAPVSNLYEVFILLCCITGTIYLAFERRYRTTGLGAFVMLLIACAVFFTVWLGSIGQADIKPLVPALQSYWMKIHVPLNFIGYGSFAVACAAGMAWLLRAKLEAKGRKELLALFPTLDQLDLLAYRAIAIGFPAFTLATILGAAWAAEAWGGYWSWDPKETWALIVWLVYGAWLHVRVSHGWSGRVLAWWSVIAFLVTLFCFIGVNMYLSGLHSYGRLT